MILFSVILILIFLHYSYLLNKIALKIAIDPSFKHDSKTLHKISIIIPFRNEAQNLKSVILSLLELEYNLDSFEILFINDHSEDDYKSVFDEFASVNNIHLIDSNGEGKKAAIETGIRNARFNWILSSDADCNFDSTWLFSCNHTINTQHSDLFILPVYTAYGKSVLAKFQHYDSLSILGVNVGYYSWKNIVLLASGANLLYKKNKFEEANPFVNNKNIHSGDDMFILQEFKKLKFNVSVNINNGLWVRTKDNSTWKKTIDQRIRWAKKMGSLNKDHAFFFGLYFLLIQCILILSFAVAIVINYMWIVFLILIILKASFDTKLMKRIGLPIHLNIKFIEVFFLEFVYMLIVPLLLILSIFRKPKWKERKISS